MNSPADLPFRGKVVASPIDGSSLGFQIGEPNVKLILEISRLIRGIKNTNQALYFFFPYADKKSLLIITQITDIPEL